MASIIYPNTFTNGTIADATQVNANFDAIAAQVNGNLDTTNIKDAAITLAKLASGVGAIEAIHYESNDNPVIYSTLTKILSHTITLSSARYCLILAKGITIGDPQGMSYIGDGNSILDFTQFTIPAAPMLYFPISLFYYGQLASGSHAIELSCVSNAGENKGCYYSKLVIVQFGF